MKTAVAVLVAAGLIGVAAGCGDDDGGDTTTAAATTAADTTATTPPADTTATTPADTTETSADTTAETTAGGDLLSPDEVKSAVEGAAGITLTEQGSGPGGSTVYSNAASAVQDGSIAVVYVVNDPTAAEALAQNPPALPVPGGNATTFFYKNVFVAYAAIQGDDKGPEVEAAVKAL
jgi:hypothetical protein